MELKPGGNFSSYKVSNNSDFYFIKKRTSVRRAKKEKKDMRMKTAEKSK